MKKALVIYNPVSGSSFFRKTPEKIKSILKKYGFVSTWYETKKNNKQDFLGVINENFNKIIVFGGDGTVSEVCAFVIEKKIRVPVVIVAQGSANILALALDLLFFRLEKALVFGLKNKGRFLDAMRINKKYYSTVAVGSGYDAFVMTRTTRPLKRILGFMAYFLTIFSTYFSFASRPFKLNIDGERHYLVAKSVMVFNVMPFNRLRISRNILKSTVNGEDGLLNIFALNTCSLWDILTFRPKLQAFTGRKIVIKSQKERKFQIDGDFFKTKVMDIEIIPDALKIVY